MTTTIEFQGKVMYYENINGKEKKIFKEFDDPRKFNEFIEKHPIPSLEKMVKSISPKKKALASKAKKLVLNKK